MRIPHKALIALANGERFVLMRNVGQLAEWLNDKALKGDLEQVVVAADPKTLGQIRRHCHRQVENRIVGELAKDLINSPIETIERALADA